MREIHRGDSINAIPSIVIGGPEVGSGIAEAFRRGRPPESLRGWVGFSAEPVETATEVVEDHPHRFDPGSIA
jgi:hypothetical protein